MLYLFYEFLQGIEIVIRLTGLIVINLLLRCLRIVQNLLQQSAEKIDRTRLHAGNLLMEFLHRVYVYK